MSCENQKVHWSHCVGVCTDGACSMSGFPGKAPDAVWNHCIIHMEAPAFQDLSTDLNEVLQIIINVVDYIKTNFKRLDFFKMCNKMEIEYTSLLFYNSTCLFSRGNVSLCIFELR